MFRHSNIQVENPVSVLDQEEAKKFLMGKDSDKYNFFMKATELERVYRTYASTTDTIDELQENSDKIKANLEPATAKVKELKHNYDQHVAVEKLEDKVKEIRCKYAWGVYQNTAESHQEAFKNWQLFEQKAAQKQEELTQAEEAANQPDDEVRAKEARIAELVAEAEEQAASKMEMEHELKEKLGPQRKKENQLKQVLKQKEATKKELAAARRRLQAVRDEILEQAGSAESEQARRAKELKDAEEQLAQAQTRADSLKEAVSVAFRQFEELEPHVKEARDKARQYKGRLEAAKNALRSLEQTGDEFALLGPRVKKVYSAVRAV